MRLTFQVYLGTEGVKTSDAAWSIADAVGDAEFPNPESWPELRDGLKRRGARRATIKDALDI
jgi:hypothetical protein